jgi:hypothetical protein
MTAIIDIVVVEPGYGVLGEAGLFTPKWLLYQYTDTSGLWKRDRSRNFIRDIKGVGVIIDALFGDGPTRYNLPTSPVVLADFNYQKNKVINILETDSPEEKCLVQRTDFMEKLIQFQKKESDKNWNPYAIPLKDFLELTKKIPLNDMGDKSNYVASINAFLSALEPGGQRIIPLMGGGLYFDFPEISDACGHRTSIVGLR